MPSVICDSTQDLFAMLAEHDVDQDEHADDIMAADVPLNLKIEEVRKLHKNIDKDIPSNPPKAKQNKKSQSKLEKTEGTGGT